MIYYYYLHTNGSLIGKSALVVESDPDYFDSPFVKKFWRIDTTMRKDLWCMVLEAIALGADIERIRELAEKWSMTKYDAVEMLRRVADPSELMKKGLDGFIREILNMDQERFWSDVKERW